MTDSTLGTYENPQPAMGIFCAEASGGTKKFYKIGSKVDADAAYALAKEAKALASTDATTTVKGVVLLSSATDSTAENVAATPAAVKIAYDLAEEAKNASSNSGEAIGSLKMWPGTSIPDGWLLCNGAAVSRTDYAELFAVIGTTWGSGDGSTTFNLPESRDYYFVGGSTPGQTIAASLPNITGNVGVPPSWVNVDGAFYRGASTGAAYEGSYTTTTYQKMDASLCSSIYSSSTSTVRPPSKTVLFLIKAA